MQQEHQKKMSMSKKKFRIGELAKELKIKKYVIRFWEKEFDLKSDRSVGGQRFYTSHDYDLFVAIKDLLYNRGFTIVGAKKELSLIQKKLGDHEVHAHVLHKTVSYEGKSVKGQVIGAKKEFVFYKERYIDACRHIEKIKEKLIALNNRLSP